MLLNCYYFKLVKKDIQVVDTMFYICKPLHKCEMLLVSIAEWVYRSYSEI